MKNIYILKGWFNMEEIKNGVISEEALDEIAGGLKISKSTVKKALTAAGVIVGALGAIGGTTIAGYEIYKHKKNKKDKGNNKSENEQVIIDRYKSNVNSGIGNLKDVDMEGFQDLLK